MSLRIISTSDSISKNIKLDLIHAGSLNYGDQVMVALKHIYSQFENKI